MGWKYIIKKNETIKKTYQCQGWVTMVDIGGCDMVL